MSQTDEMSAERWLKVEGFAPCIECGKPSCQTFGGVRLHKCCLPAMPFGREPEPEAVRWNALMALLIGLWPERPPLSVRLAAAKAADAIVQEWFDR